MALKLPRGSAHISISEVTPSSSNYIALKGEKSKNFINGRYRVLHAGHSPLTFAGSLWSYDRLSNGAESIKTEGQTNEKVEVYILAAEMYDGITFSFNLLNSKMHDIDAPVYLWRALDWGSCEGDSEQGHQERNVTCNEIDPELQVETQVSENYCRSLPKPISQQECSMESYYYSWVVSEWSQCNVSCGGIGIETRNVTCQRNITEKDGTNNVVMDDHICPRKQPRNIRTCNQGACQYKWNYGSWGSCDSVCGEGWMKREVWCVWREDTVVSPSLCRDENKPDNKVTCQSSAGNCSDYQWAVSEWNEVYLYREQFITALECYEKAIGKIHSSSYSNYTGVGLVQRRKFANENINQLATKPLLRLPIPTFVYKWTFLSCLEGYKPQL